MSNTNEGYWRNQQACNIGIRFFNGFKIDTILLKLTQWLLYVFEIIQRKKCDAKYLIAQTK